MAYRRSLAALFDGGGPAPSFQVLRDQLRERGHVEGRDFVFEYRWAAELVVNRKMAKTLGLTFPRAILIQADHVIE